MLFPFGGNAREALACMLGPGAVARPAGFVDDDPDTHERECCGVPVLGGREWLSRMPYVRVLAVPGSPATYRKRADIIDGLGLARGRFATLVHAHASVARDVELGVNTLVMPGAFVGPGAVVGDHCLIMAGAVVSHDTRVGAYSIVAAGAVLAGFVTVGRGCYLGAGCRLREGVQVGDGALVGMGAVVLADVPPDETWAGIPARRLAEADA
nr:NeuD/PglB/VioB family sugar acetyltransferase [Desulfobaculum xiamenense]